MTFLGTDSAKRVTAKNELPFMSAKKRKAVTVADERAEETLWECLNEIPFLQESRVRVEQRLISEPGKPDVEARLRIEDEEMIIYGQVQENGQPRLVREAIHELSAWCQMHAGSYGVVIAPELSQEGMKICKQEGVGYLDYSGNCFLNFDHVFISKTGRLKEIEKRKKSRSWYSPRAERVVRTLLLHPRRVWRIRDLANESLVTPNQALHIKDHLAQWFWISDERDGFRLVEPALLLDDWSKNYLPGRSTERRFQTEKPIIETEMALAGICQKQAIPYALMGFSAAMRYDAMLRHNRVSAYVLSDLSQIVSDLELTEAKQGNVSLWIPYDEGVLRGSHDFLGMKVTSPVQTYLDLIGADGKGEKTAHAIWETFIKTKWDDKLTGESTLISYTPPATPSTAAA
jgi:hypothetical protein